ncbi:DUF3857 domain-containing protein [Flavobacterium panici]|uniref:DUF3857 domain-containing protein n=1 Tax=Flavobacterium panici TaxID=2654843 RepID=A0A9N8P1C7_9FLAO|nr:DUF3857 domain-containing protein [Flavobacterium panici]CAC9973981.1 hypothetical protein FLAPXU55_01674 [Flavobacterium panici]
MNKTLLIFFITICFSSYSQDKTEVKDFFWGKSDTFKTVTKTPDKWKNESAVIIYKYEHYDYHNSGVKVVFTSAYRQRLKLQDENSVKEFSEFSFKNKFYSSRGYSYKQGTTFLGVKIVKPDGKEIEVDVDKDAKKVDDQKKIAINGLEIGDIIDYYYYSYEPFASLTQNFEPVENTLGDVYPIMSRKMKFLVEEDFYVNFNTYHGAPELKEVESGKKHTKAYELTAQNVEKEEFLRWFYPLVELPCYKFQVFFAKKSGDAVPYNSQIFLPKKNESFRKTVDKDDIFDYYEKKFHAVFDLGETLKFLKGKTFESEEEKIKAVYLFARHQYYTQFIESAVIKEADIFNSYAMYKNPDFFSNEWSFISYFMAYMKEFKIDYNIVLATARNNGSLDELLIQKNLTPLLRINTPTPLYLEYCNPFTTPGTIDYNLENTKGYIMDFVSNRTIANVKEVNLPSTTVKDNVTKVVTNVSMDADLSSLNVKRASEFYGHFKSDEQKDKLKFYDYVEEDYQKYGTERVIDKVGSKSKREQYNKEFDALKNKLKDIQKEDEKKSLSGEFDFEIENPTIKITNTGRYGDNSPVSYEEEFVIKNNFIKKAGENYIVEIGKMLTNQLEIDKKEVDRKNNVYMPFPRAFENEIVFEIPARYKISGIEKLNKNVQNSTGEFSSTAVLKDNKLIIKTVKKYNNYYEPNANWNKIVDFLEAAYQFTQEKVLLKKQ